MCITDEIEKTVKELITHQEIFDAISEDLVLSIEGESLKKILDSLYARLESLVDLLESSKQNIPYLQKEFIREMLQELSMLSDRDLRSLAKPFAPTMRLRKSRFKRRAPVQVKK